MTYAIWQRILVTAANILLCEAAGSQQTIDAKNVKIDHLHHENAANE